MPKTNDGLRIDLLSYSKIEQLFADKPALIFPVAGLEPLGGRAAVGANNRCCELIAAALSRKTDTYRTPLLAYGYTTPYSMFGGCSGIKQQIFTSLIYSLLRDYILQGVKYICLVDNTYDNYEPLLGAVKRINQRGRAKVFIFSWQREPEIRSFIAQNSLVREPGRSEYGLLSLSSFCAPELIFDSPENSEAKRNSSESYQVWRRRGRDPQRYRKMFPEGLVGEGGYDPAFGKELFEKIISLGEKIIIQTCR